jgi:hypothetical protein
MGIEFARLFVSPQGKHQCLFGYEDHEIQVLADLETWPSTCTCTASDKGWLAGVCDDGLIRVARYQSATGIVDERILTTPPGTGVDCIILDEHRLFAGGAQSEDLSADETFSESHPWVAWIDLSNTSPEWTPLTRPDLHANLPYKRVDAFALTPGHVIALDNVVQPLFAIRLRRGTARKHPEFVDIVGLPVHYTYEKIENATHNERYIAWLSSGINHGVSGQFISVCYHDCFPEERVYFSQFSDWRRSLRLEEAEEPGRYSSSQHGWQDIALCDDYIVIATGGKAYGIASINDNDLAYVDVDGIVASVHGMPAGTNYIVLAYSKDDEWHTELVTLPIGKLQDLQERRLHEVAPNLVSSIEDKFSVRYGIGRTNLVPHCGIPFDLFVRDGTIHIQFEHDYFHSESLGELNAKIFVGLLKRKMLDEDQMPSSSYEVDLAKHPVEKIQQFLYETVELMSATNS